MSKEPLGFEVLIPLFVVGSALVFAWAWWVRAVNLALGLGVAVAMWALTYLALLQPGFAVAELLFGLAVLSVAGGGYLAGRFGGPQANGMAVGIVSAVANTMMVGATLPKGEDRAAIGMQFGAIMVGMLVVSAALGWAGFRVGRAHAQRGGMQDAPARFDASAGMALVNTVALFCMLVLGGLVTSLEAGLAVPDWPNSFGHNMLLYPLSQMKGGAFYEHSHRLFGMLVGATTLATCATVFKSRRTALPRAIAVALLLLVVSQGVLGGLRVTGNATTSVNPADLAPRTDLAMVHGMVGQILVALSAVLTLVLGPKWQEQQPVVLANASSVRLLPALATCALLVQLFLGVAIRQLQTAPTETAGTKIPSWALHGHITMAIVALVLVIIAGLKCGAVTQVPSLRRNGKAALHTVSLQVLLGGGALIAILVRRGPDVPWWEATAATAHQAVGALLLAVMAMLWARSRRFVLPQA